MSALLKHAPFLASVQAYIKDNPEVAAHISDFVAAGIADALQNALQRAADMELALLVSLTKRDRKYWAGIIAEKMARWDSNGQSVAWKNAIADLNRLAGKP